MADNPEYEEDFEEEEEEETLGEVSKRFSPSQSLWAFFDNLIIFNVVRFNVSSPILTQSFIYPSKLIG